MIHCKEYMRDWGYKRDSILEDSVPHFYCQKCGSHYHIDKWYTKEEWFFFINGEIHEKVINAPVQRGPETRDNPPD